MNKTILKKQIHPENACSLQIFCNKNILLLINIFKNYLKVKDAAAYVKRSPENLCISNITNRS